MIVVTCRECRVVFVASKRTREWCSSRCYQSFHRRLPGGRERYAQYARKYRSTENGRSETHRINKANRNKHPEKSAAHHAVYMAVRSGKAFKPDMCSACGAPGRIEAHHYMGYARENRLNVRWVCSPCHKDCDVGRMDTADRASVESPTIPETKRCNDCHETLPWASFYSFIGSHGYTRLLAYCRECSRARDRLRHLRGRVRRRRERAAG